MNRPGIAVAGEDDRSVGGEEEGVELGVGHPVGVFAVRLETHQINDVDHPDLEPGGDAGV